MIFTMLMNNITQGEIWVIRLNPTIGAELKKERPVIVMSSDETGILPIKLIAPVTAWKDSFRGRFWLVQISATEQTGLTKSSAVDVLQMRGVDTSRFVRKLGVLEAESLDDIRDALALVVAAKKEDM
jgi:mRNA interferase MazF